MFTFGKCELEGGLARVESRKNLFLNDIGLGSTNANEKGVRGERNNICLTYASSNGGTPCDQLIKVGEQVWRVSSNLDDENILDAMITS